MSKRKSDTFLWYVVANICVLLLLFTHAFFERKKACAPFDESNQDGA